VIRSFKGKALKRFWIKGDPSKLPSDQVKRIRRMLLVLDNAAQPEDMNIPGYRFHELKGDRSSTYSITVSGNWRITFRFDDGDAYVLDHEDYR
jgi:proteic killer suppression protein